MVRRLWGILAVVVLAGVAAAELPADRTLSYVVADDPNSPPLFELLVSVEATGQSGAVVYWRIVAIELWEYSGSEVVATWTDTSPEAAGGDWAVTHADPEAVLESEFEDLPLVGGLAEGLGGELAYTVGAESGGGGSGLQLEYELLDLGTMEPVAGVSPVLIRPPGSLPPGA